MYNVCIAVTLAQACAHYHTNVRRHDDSAMLWDWGLELILQTGPWTCWSLKGREWCRGTAVTPLIIVYAHSCNIVNAILRRSNIEQNLLRGGNVNLFKWMYPTTVRLHYWKDLPRIEELVERQEGVIGLLYTDRLCVKAICWELKMYFGIIQSQIHMWWNYLYAL